VVGLAAAWVSAQAGSPTVSGPIALLCGPVALLVAGRMSKLRGVGDWVRAGVVAVAVITIVGMTGILVGTVLTYG
jgi:hypothetical protein